MRNIEVEVRIERARGSAAAERDVIPYRPPAKIIPTRVDSCAACLREPHSHHAEAHEAAPIIFCRTCDRPTRHRFSHEAPRSIGQGGVHLVWACSICENNRIYGCTG